jgi:uncharacterized protein DUF6632
LKKNALSSFTAFSTSESASIPTNAAQDYQQTPQDSRQSYVRAIDARARKEDSRSRSKRLSIESEDLHEAKFYQWLVEEEIMADTARIKYLRIALQAVGVIFIVGIYGLVVIWPSGWSWHSGPSHHLPHYLQMILGVYATLGIFLLIASRNPLANLSLIWFTVWSSVAHAGIMAAQALANPEQVGHLWGDVPALLVIAAVLAFLTPRDTVATALAAGNK